MKKIVLACLLLVSFVALAQIKDEIWQKLPDWSKTSFITKDLFMIQAFIFTCETYQLVMPGDDCLLYEALHKYFDGRPILSVWVASINFQPQFFSPLFFVVMQGNKTWFIKSGDYFSLEPTFYGGYLAVGDVIYGFLALPGELDLAQPFRLWYRAQYGEFKPSSS